MTFRQGSWISRLMAISILLLLLLAGHRLLFTPLFDRYTANELRIEQMSDLLQRYRALEANKPALVQHLADIQNGDDLANGYWEGASAAMTATKLQDRASQSVKDHGGNVISMQAIDLSKAETDQARERATLRMRLATTVDGLAATMHDLETAIPYMFINELIITQERRRSGNFGQIDADEAEPTLDVRLDVFGFLSTEPASSDGPADADQ